MRFNNYLNTKVFLLLSVVMVMSCRVATTPQENLHGTDIPSLSPEKITPFSLTPNINLIPTNIPPYEGEEDILYLYTDNGGCQLPCLWGIEPGKTSTEEVMILFSRIGEISQEDYPWSGEYTLRGIQISTPFEINLYKKRQMGFGMVSRNGIVESLSISSMYLQQTSIPSISNMLTVFGEPEEIWVAIVDFFPHDKSTTYKIALFYPSKGILVRGSGNTDIIYEDEENVKFPLCPHLIDDTIDMQIHFPFRLDLWSSENKKTFSDLSYQNKSFEFRSFQPFENSNSSISIETFYKIYIDPFAKECFDWRIKILPVN